MERRLTLLYASADRALAEAVARGLRRVGGVLVPIEAKPDFTRHVCPSSSRSVTWLLLWSHAARRSNRVAWHLKTALEGQVPLLVVVLDDHPPHPVLVDRPRFDLCGWGGQHDDRRWIELIERLRYLFAPESAPRQGAPSDGVSPPSSVPQFDWVPIPAGKVRLADGGSAKVGCFEISRFPVTEGQFKCFTDQSAYPQPSQPPNDLPVWWRYFRRLPPRPAPMPEDGADLPRTRVCWFEAMAFCRWLWHFSGYQVALPSEAQWMRAARGDASHLFPWGDDPSRGRANLSPDPDSAMDPSQGKVCAIGSFDGDTSYHGVRDMLGNVHEWCITGPESPLTFDLRVDRRRVYKGGCYATPRHAAVIGLRRHASPDLRADTIGFRLIRPCQWQQ